MNKTWLILLAIFAVLVLCFCCICILSIGIIVAAINIPAIDTSGDVSLFFSNPTATPQVLRPIEQGTLVPINQDTLNLLELTELPEAYLPELAQRFEGKRDIPLTVEPPTQLLEVGVQQSFWLTNVDTNESFQVSATLQYVTPHGYYWVQDGVEFDQEELASVAETFENQIYPTNLNFFGTEWSPGVDGDPHIYILYASGVGRNLAGYFSSVDEYHPLAHEYSNAHEMILFNSDNVVLDEDFTLGVLAHEHQHMIHWFRDRNESSWLNEGFSELAAFLNGYDVGGSDYIYSLDPDVQLNDWPNDPDDTTPHYGAAFLFTTYFLSRFGEQATQALVAHPKNGLASIDQVLLEIDAQDPVTGEQVTADDAFLDWVIASYLQNNNLGDGRYDYHLYQDAPQVSETETISTCPQEFLTRDVHQYGVDYIRITCQGRFNLHFEGSTKVQVVPANPYSGEYAFWSNKGDESDMTLTQSFDFTNTDGPISLVYWTWFDIEEDYDYLYLVASLDGENWQILTTPSGTDEDPTGNSYGWGYNGVSAGWIQENVDLSQFAGEQVIIRFEYVTDAAVNGEGFLIDDISIPEIGYFANFESGMNGWDASGFVRIKNELPQTYRLALITKGVETKVDYIDLANDNEITIPITLVGGDEVILIVAGTTRHTREKTAYWLEIYP